MNILFLCTHNSCRSQIAEGFAKAIADQDVRIYSAGTHPTKRVHPLAIEVMKELGIDITYYKPKSLDDLQGIDFDIVISVCSKASEQCPIFPGQLAHIAWNLPDPEKKFKRQEEISLKLLIF